MSTPSISRIVSETTISAISQATDVKINEFRQARADKKQRLLGKVKDEILGGVTDEIAAAQAAAQAAYEANKAARAAQANLEAAISALRAKNVGFSYGGNADAEGKVVTEAFVNQGVAEKNMKNFKLFETNTRARVEDVAVQRDSAIRTIRRGGEVNLQEYIAGLDELLSQPFGSKTSAGAGAAGLTVIPGAVTEAVAS